MKPERSCFALLLWLLSALSSRAQTVSIDWHDVHQRIDGFGAAATQRRTFNLTPEQADLFFSPDKGIGLSLVRALVPPDETVPGCVTLQEASARGVVVWANEYSPAPEMKTNHSLIKGSLLPSFYQAYADHFAAYVHRLKEQCGIDLYALSVQNEPDADVPYASTSWTGEQFRDFIRDFLAPTFANAGISAKIMMPEQEGWGFGLAEATLADPNASAAVSIFAAHAYSPPEALAPVPQVKNLGKQLWETEISDFNPLDKGMASALNYAQQANDWLTVAEVNAWHYWSLIPNNPSDNQGLAQMNGKPTKRLWAIGNFSKFIRPGYVRIGTTGSAGRGVSVSAYKDPGSGAWAIVAINHNKNDLPVTFSFQGFRAASASPWVTSKSRDLVQEAPIVAGDGFATKLPAQSVTTFVGKALPEGQASP